MSKINAITPYQFETFGARAGIASRREHGNNPRDGGERRGHARRETPFLVQIMVGGDAELRVPLGRHDEAERREIAYASALGNRPSARPLSFLRIVGDA
ncbi:MAG: hypothetical protein LCH38_07605 [Proteobacteria bacterium]|nr:hypothetical protein [Pseudomonadota bacterium]